MTLLSHYTSRAGLEGIARTKSLWAGNFFQMNDKVELIYGLREVTLRALRAAFVEMRKHEIPGHPIGDVIDKDFLDLLTAHYVQTFRNTNVNEHLHIFSFARATTQHQEDFGHRSLWREYTGNKGYCLQFLQTDIESLISIESHIRTYLLLELAEVRYEMRDDEELEWLVHENKERLLAFVAQAKPGLGLRPDLTKLAPFEVGAMRMMRYCAKHKDPFFEDEREIRVLALPSPINVARFGISPRGKPVRRRDDGRSYVGLFEDIKPGIEPVRIIVGPAASPDLENVLPLFTRRPIVIRADFPLRLDSEED
jgi:hypothetical protein